MSTQVRAPARHRLLVTVVAGGVFASVASIPMLLLASRALVRDFGVSYADLQWRNLLFWTAFGVTLPFFGRLTERVAPRVQFLSGIAVFVVSAVLGALAGSWALFLVSPVLQGLADAIVVGAQAVLIRALLPAERVGWAFGWQGAVLALAQLGSPALGGLLLEHASWRAVYWVVAGVGVAAGAGALAILPSGRPARKIRKAREAREARLALPVRSTLMLALVVTGWQAVILVGEAMRGPVAIAAAAATAVFVITERRSPAATRYLPAGLLRNKVFLSASLRGLLLYFPANAVAMFLPLYLVAVDGWATGLAGLVLLIDAAVITFLGGTAGRYADRNPALVIRVGFAGLAGSGVVLSAGAGHLAWVCLALVLLGAGTALTVPGQSKIAMDAAPEHQTGTYMSVFQSAQFVSIGLATVVFAPLMQGHQAQSLSRSGFGILCLISAALFAAGALSVVRTGRAPLPFGSLAGE